MQTKNAPKVYPINQLPQFVQACVSKIWEENGGAPKDTSNIVYTFFDGIYTLNPMPQDLFIHESVHYVRQGAGENKELAMEWWFKYTEDPQFRYDEELLAYREQYKFVKSKATSPVAFEYAKRLARELSGKNYGNMVSFEKALFSITKND